MKIGSADTFYFYPNRPGTHTIYLSRDGGDTYEEDPVGTVEVADDADPETLVSYVYTATAPEAESCYLKAVDPDGAWFVISDEFSITDVPVAAACNSVLAIFAGIGI